MAKSSFLEDAQRVDMEYEEEESVHSDIPGPDFQLVLLKTQDELSLPLFDKLYSGCNHYSFRNIKDAQSFVHPLNNRNNA